MSLSPRPPRALAWAGVVGPVLFGGVFTVEGWLRPGYDASGMFVSALSLGPRGFVQIINFLVFGVLLLAFSRAVAAGFPEGRASRAGPKLIAVIGACILASGPAVMDPAGTPPAAMSAHGILHQLFGAVVFTCMPASCFVFRRRFRADPAWQSLAPWTLAAGTAIVAGVVLLKLGQRPPVEALSAMAHWVGAFQRLALVTWLVWLFTFAVGLLRRSRSVVGARIVPIH